MWYYMTKVLVSAVLIVAISEVAKRSSVLGAILASVPLVSVIAMIWLYHETGDTAKISALATSIFWLVIPSLALFLALPALLKNGFSFYLSMLIAIAVTVLCYFLMLTGLKLFGIHI
ncbi:MAG: DUF3147 family protein [Methylophaga sp.]|nr:DUF3147 family protein [Methylophaga sp.]